MNFSKNLKYSLVFPLVLVSFLCIPTLAQATTYYVAKNGNDSDPGTEAEPWLTIQKAADTMAAGDTTYVKEGTYYQFRVDFNGKSGEEGNPITLRTYGNDEVMLDASDETLATSDNHWTLDTGSIYYASVAEFEYEVKKVWEDTTFLTKRTSKEAMEGSDWYYDDVADKLYVWCTDNADPDTHEMHVIQYRPGDCPNIRFWTSNYIVVDGFILQYAVCRGVFIWDSDHIQLKNMEIKYEDDGIGIGGWSEYTTIENCNIHNNYYGITATFVNYLTIDSNTVHNNVAVNLDLTRGTHAIVKNNIVYNATGGFYIISFEDSEIYNNHIYSCYTYGLLSSYHELPNARNKWYGNIVHDCPCGLWAKKEDGSSVNHEYYNNVFYNVGSGGVALLFEGETDIKFYNNTCFATSDEDGLQLSNATTGFEAKNNIISVSGNKFALKVEDTSYIDADFDYNCYENRNGTKAISWYDGESTTEYNESDINGGIFFFSEGQGQHSIALDPKFVDAVNHDFHLKSKAGHYHDGGWIKDAEDSPCIDAGTSDGAPTTDIEGNPRYDDPATPNTGGGVYPYYDIGAYEYQGPDFTPPAAITNLSTSDPTQNSIKLTWTAPGDDGNVGTASSYDIRYSTSTITDGNWDSATQATGEPTPSIVGTTETFTVTGLSPNTTYYFAIKTSDEVPNESDLSNIASETTLSSPNDHNGGGDTCFIATAAYGTPMAEEVKVLCEFRNKYLLASPLGRASVRFYCQYSPVVADFIRTKKSLRAMARAYLKPIVWLAKRIMSDEL